MTEDKLQKGIELLKNKNFVNQAIGSLEQDTCIYIGSSQRMDENMDIHNRLSNVLLKELKSIVKEIDKQIKEL